MSARPEPVEAYRLCDLPLGTEYRISENGPTYLKRPEHVGTASVYVVEWPQRTYDGIPADDLDAVLNAAAWFGVTKAIRNIRAAIAAQEDGQ